MVSQNGKTFFERVRKGYIKIAKDNKDRFIKINASLDIDQIHQKIIKHIGL